MKLVVTNTYFQKKKKSSEKHIKVEDGHLSGLHSTEKEEYERNKRL